MALLSRIKESTFSRSIKLLSSSDRQKMGIVVVLQILMGGLDLLGIALIGILGALAVSGVESHATGTRVSAVLKDLGLFNLSFQKQVTYLGLLATFILIFKTAMSIFFTRRILFFLARRGAVISTRLTSQLLKQPLLMIQRRTIQETIFAVTAGVESITLGILGVAINLITDGSLLVIIAAGLFILDPVLAFSTFIFFSLIACLLYLRMHRRASILGHQQTLLSIGSNEKIAEVIISYRESVVRNRRAFYAEQIGKLRSGLAETQAELTFMPNVSKYVIETTIVIGALIMSGIQFARNDATHAVATLTVFMAAASRIAPAVLRAQQGLIKIKSGIGNAIPTLNLIDELGSGWDTQEVIPPSLSFSHPEFTPKIDVSHVSLTYPGKEIPAIKDATFKIIEGESIAIVGASGAGKTSMVDLLLGVIQPSSGEILISGKRPLDAIDKWPGAIGYVPQNVMIANGTIRDNVSMGYPREEFTDEDVWASLNLAQMKGFIDELPDGIDTQVGESGNRISGGQRQRLGIARALFTRPQFLVLDEATSALDGQTEYDISGAISALKGSVTTILVAHRLSTVRNVDRVIYFEKGEIIAQGTFDEVRVSVPDFDRQASLMGL